MDILTKEQKAKLDSGMTPVLSHREYMSGQSGPMYNLIGWASSEQEALAILKDECGDLDEGIVLTGVETSQIEIQDEEGHYGTHTKYSLVSVFLPVYS